MRKFLFIPLILVLLPLSVSGFDLSFDNDGCSWGFIPEWDDFETYSLTLSEEWKLHGAGSSPRILTDLGYRCYTLRTDGTAASSRIDSVEASAGIGRLHILGAVEFDINLAGTARFFGNFSGLLIQTGWHGNVNVLRPVPENYDSPFFQFNLPVSGRLRHNKLPGAELSLDISAGFPFELEADARLGWDLGIFQVALKPAVGWKGGIYNESSQAYQTSKIKQTGIYIADEISCWPLYASRVYFFQQAWGTGSFGFSTADPGTESDESAAELILSGIFHHSYGVKVRRSIAANLTPGNLSLELTGTSLNGWLPDRFDDGEGGRFSKIAAGLDTAVILDISPFSLELYIPVNIGIRQNNYYSLAVTEMKPESTLAALFAEAGAGLRFMFPFFHGRMIGISFEGLYEQRIFEFTEAVAGRPAAVPYRLNLGIAASGRKN